MTNRSKDYASQPANEQQQTVDDLGPWFHNLHLPDGTETAPKHPLGDFPRFKWQQIAAHLPASLQDWRVLDIGCNAGFYSFELARRGAQVTGIDVNPHYLRQARWAVGQYGLQDQADFKQMQVYDLAHWHEAFDLVLFMGVFYHLRYPLLALDILAGKTKRLMVFQTLIMPGEEVFADTVNRGMYAEQVGIADSEVLLEPGWPKMAFIEDRFAGDPTNWWIPNHAGVEAMLRSSDLRVTARPGSDIYICEPHPFVTPYMKEANVAEMFSATGQAWCKEREQQQPKQSEAEHAEAD